ncbi:MAG: hypothetical protein HY778_01800 [Betaproteobacteria bacterium]|nr:hypothetical protein [Betaproteobacteria bacterium]
MSTPARDARTVTPGALAAWIDRNILDLGRQMRLSYLPPLMVYVAAGISGLTAIVGTFFVKEYLGLSAQFLAALGFWATLPWAVKLPLGHLVDLIWRHKAGLVWLGAGLIAASLLIMLGLLTDRAAMQALLPVETWYVVSALLAPLGYVVQDVVADAMTVEAVPRVDDDGRPVEPEARRLMHATMQTLGRVAIIGGTVLVALVNVLMFRGVEALPEAGKAAVYTQIYAMALVIPLVSVAGVMLAGWLRRRHARALTRQGLGREEIDALLHGVAEKHTPNWWILGGGLAFGLVSLAVGVNDLRFGQELIFSVSMTIVVFLMWRLVRELDAEARGVLVGTALMVFVFRALPGPGPGSTWWMIDQLGFDQQFLSQLALLSNGMTLAGLFLFRRFMAERSMAYIIGFLTLAGTALSLPIVGMYYGLHQWTAALTGGVVDARFIALIDTALESPLGQIAMVPMLAWIANSAPAHLKATYFAVMASFTNLALALSQIATKHLNGLLVVRREVRDAVTGAVSMPADYSQLGVLLVSTTVLGLVLPFIAIAAARAGGWRGA